LVVLGLILPEIQRFSFPIRLNFGSKRASMSATYDVIFLVIAGLPKVYPNFLDVPHSVLQQCEEKLRAPLMHTGSPSAYSLTIVWHDVSVVSNDEIDSVCPCYQNVTLLTSSSSPVRALQRGQRSVRASEDRRSTYQFTSRTR